MNHILPEFQKFLLRKKLVPEKNAPFYAYGGGKFFVYARKHNLVTIEYQGNAVIDFRISSVYLTFSLFR